MPFSAAQRYAIWTTHDERCWLCEKPVGLLEVEIDHVVPRSLAGTAKLLEILAEFGLPLDFSLNSYANLLPAHPRCNRAKAETTFAPSPLIQLRLTRAKDRSTKVAALVEQAGSERRIGRAILELVAARDKGLLTEEHTRTIAAEFGALHEPNREPPERGKPALLAPGLEIVSDNGHYLLLRGRGGMVGARPKGDHLDPSWDCPNCGVTGWNGVRCIQCGMMSDD